MNSKRRDGIDMLKYFEVRNYRNFKDTIGIHFDKVGGYQFNTECISVATINKMLIYGRNATGKTNLGRAIMDVTTHMTDLYNRTVYYKSYLNADSKEEVASFKYIFQFEEDEIIYKYKKISEKQLYDEELIKNENRVFYFNYETGENDFNYLQELDIDDVLTKRYIDARNMRKHGGTNDIVPFFRWMINNTALQDKSLLKLDEFINHMKMSIQHDATFTRNKGFHELLFDSLDHELGLEEFEEFLNIMGVACKLKMELLPNGEKELYFLHEELVPFFEMASSGTIALVNLYQRILLGIKASFLYMDEFDAFFHYEMSENVIKFLKKRNKNCQIVMTTHNTNLMTNRLMRPDCLFILSREGKLTSLSDATERELREGHNLEKLYISGEFDKYE